MSGTVAGTIQGEAGSPAAQFAVAAVIYNRLHSGEFGSTADEVVNAPSQFTGHSDSPSSSAQTFAQAIQDGTLPQYGNVGNAVNFQTAGSATTLGSDPSAVNIGGNNFSDNFGPPTSNFVPPSFGGSSNESPVAIGDMGNISSFGFDPSVGNLPDPLSSGNIPVSGTEQPIIDTAGNPIGTSVNFNGGSGGLTYSTKPEQSGVAPPAKQSFDIPDVGAAISSGFNAITAGFSAQVGKFISDAEAYAGRGFVMLFAIGIFLAGAWLLVPRDTKQAVIGTAAKAIA